MFNMLDRFYIGAQIKKRAFIQNLKNDESGVSNFVATVLLILIVVMVGGLVWTFLGEYFEKLFKQITDKGTGIIE